jgi:hypothetical protein
MGHVTIDLIAFPNTDGEEMHPFFQAIDISLELTNNAAIVYFFDILMEGKLDQQTGEYSIAQIKDEEEVEDISLDPTSPKVGDMNAVSQLEVQSEARSRMNVTGDMSVLGGKKAQAYEPRGFMYSPFLHHPGLANI